MPYFLFANFDVSEYELMYYPRKTAGYLCCSSDLGEVVL
jgi:hypothetical protein